MIVTIDKIQNEVEKYFNMVPGELNIPTKKGEIVQARQKAMFLCKAF